MDKEIFQLLDHIEKMQESSYRFFVSPIVTRVEKDGSMKLALALRELNKQENNNKNQMQNIE